MPHARTCIDCGQLMPYERGTRCDKCEHTRSSRARAAHNHATAYYRSKDWKTLSRIVTGAGCLVCGKTKYEARIIAHHIKPRNDGGTDTLDNLAPLCLQHHNEVEADLRAGRSTPLTERVSNYHTT